MTRYKRIWKLGKKLKKPMCICEGYEEAIKACGRNCPPKWLLQQRAKTVTRYLWLEERIRKLRALGI